jgi:hypothetical protein
MHDAIRPEAAYLGCQFQKRKIYELDRCIHVKLVSHSLRSGGSFFVIWGVAVFKDEFREHSGSQLWHCETGEAYSNNYSIYHRWFIFLWSLSGNSLYSLFVHQENGAHLNHQFHL